MTQPSLRNLASSLKAIVNFLISVTGNLAADLFSFSVEFFAPLLANFLLIAVGDKVKTMAHAVRKPGYDRDELESLVRNYHQKSFDYLKEALKLDENFDSSTKKASALNYYRKGIAELEKGLALDFGPGMVSERTTVLREKMAKNLKMTRDRVADLERELNKPLSSNNDSALRPNSAPRPTRSNHRSISPGRRVPISSPLKPKQMPTASKPSPSQPAPAQTEDVSSRVKQIKGLDAKLGHLILDQVMEKHPNVFFADIAGLENAKRALREAVILPALNPELFTGLRSPVQGLLLFGPPGNGKTMLAKAIAAEAKCKFFNISASDLTSKWVGEAEKLVKALFLLARELQPSVVFIDEIDSILCQRSQNEQEAGRRLKTEFLLQFDGVSSSASDRILIMGATNRPFDLDEAVLRRLAKRIYIPLPDMECRQELLRNLLSKQSNCSLRSDEIRSIAYMTDGYSSSDLTILAKEAAMGPLREVPTEQLTRIKDYQLRPISFNDFREALRRVKPSTKREQLRELEKFNQEHGS